MTKRSWILAVVVAACPLVAFAANAALTVKIREASVRAGPKAFKPIVATVKYGDKVERLADTKDGWVEVKTGAGAKGFLHESALTEREVAKIEGDPKGTGGGRSVASSDEVALAGKGFNPQVEAQYRADIAGNFWFKQAQPHGARIVCSRFAAQDRQFVHLH